VPHLFVRALTAGLVTLASIATAAPAHADATITVMTRNLYLGADVGVAVALIPDMPAAAQFMWDQVKATDFPARAPALAGEAARARPAVIGIQEATTWVCRTSPFSGTTTVFDFMRDFLDATAKAGEPYVLAGKGDATALNPGYSIPAIPWLTTVHDPATFQPLFGVDDAQCGFVIADALAVRADLAADVLAVGTVEYDDATSLVPLLMSIERGYAWADISVDGTPVRFVTTHLESFWKEGAVPPSAIQAQQLTRDLSDVTMPLVVMGDFNSDPRDPRTPGDNPGDQPEVGAACPPQSGSDGTCNAYWTMIGAGYADAGPDPTDPANFSWGASALLAGPDAARVPAAKAMGNTVGFTDRIDFAFLRNGVTATSASLVGNAWPTADDLWACATTQQIADTQAAAAALGVAPPNGGVCFPTDHAGVVAQLSIPESSAQDPAIPDHPHWALAAPLRILVVAAGVTGIILLIVSVLHRRRRA
jgi:hypothetical protein